MSRFQIHNGFGNRSKIYLQPIDCSKCKQIVMAEFEPIEGLTILYKFDLYKQNIKKFHQHSADSKTRNRILERVAAEKRLLDDPDPDDWVYLDSDNLEEDTA